MLTLSEAVANVLAQASQWCVASGLLTLSEAVANVLKRASQWCVASGLLRKDLGCECKTDLACAGHF